MNISTQPCPSHHRANGFALIATISVMVLLVMVALAMLSLSSIEIRGSQQAQFHAEAQANARLALMNALNDLQKELGPDRRISANASIFDSSVETPELDGVASPELLGVWDSFAPNMGSDTSGSRSAPDYDTERKNRFRRWLISHPDAEILEDMAVAGQAIQTDRMISLFSQDQDGFDLKVPMVSTAATTGSSAGAYAWAITQEGSKAHLLPASYSLASGAIAQPYAHNDILTTPELTNLSLSGLFNSVSKNEAYNNSNKITSNNQVALSAYAGAGYSKAETMKDFTTYSKGILSNTAQGGLKIDLTHAFEQTDTSFSQQSAFQSDNANFQGEKPLFQPGRGYAKEWSVQDPYTTATTVHKFKAGHLPTFDTLRSHYRLYRYLYQSENGVTAYERSRSQTGSSGYKKSRTQIMPILDRTFFFLQAAMDKQGYTQLLITPVVTLWNPYNVALESDGYTVYPWLDVPLNVTWQGIDAAGTVHRGPQQWLSRFLGSGDTGEGRSLQPYFYLKLTEDGTESPSESISFKPGEVKVFSMVDNDPRRFNRLGGFKDRTWYMKPVKSASDLKLHGGIALSMVNGGQSPGEHFRMRLTQGAKVRARVQYTKSNHKYHLSLEDMGRWSASNPEFEKGEEISNIQIDVGWGGGATQTLPSSPWITHSELNSEPYPMGVLETFHATVRGQTGGGAPRVTDIAGITNPRQPYITTLLSGGLVNYKRGQVSPYDSTLRPISDIVGSGIQLTLDAQRSYYGESNSAGTGRDILIFNEIPQSPMLSLASFQHADLSNGVFAPMHQFGNSRATPYTEMNKIHYFSQGAPVEVKPNGMDFYDFSYLVNEALWDGYFFSGASPKIYHASSPKLKNEEGYLGRGAVESDSMSTVISQFIQDPQTYPLRNGRHLLHKGGKSNEDLETLLTSPEGYKHMAGHLLVNGAFNVNSTSVEAWKAVLASNRGATLKSSDGGGLSTVQLDKNTPFTRQHQPNGTKEDAWNGFRTLTDDQIEDLAENIVIQVKKRGPFLSLADFVNRRLVSGELGQSGAIQSALDQTDFNNAYQFDSYSVNAFRFGNNISTQNRRTGVGTPGHLSQADVLQSLAPIISVRSDTFVVRTCGEAHDASGTVRAQVWCEAVIQRLPDYVDTSQDSATQPTDLNDVNKRFGRKMRIVSFRWLNSEEV